MYGIYLRYDHLCDILKISLTNDFYEISVPVTLPNRPTLSEGYCRYIPVT